LWYYSSLVFKCMYKKNWAKPTLNQSLGLQLEPKHINSIGLRPVNIFLRAIKIYTEDRKSRKPKKGLRPVRIFFLRVAKRLQIWQHIRTNLYKALSAAKISLRVIKICSEAIIPNLSRTIIFRKGELNLRVSFLLRQKEKSKIF
jgi:hypothetical protein